MLKRLITLAQLAKGKSLVVPACVIDKEYYNDAFFFEQICSGVYDKDIQTSKLIKFQHLQQGAKID
eukprot:6057778-Ditylum_brightwellii.AAC.1